MKKNIKHSMKYMSLGALATSVMLVAFISIACNNKVKVPDMNISYGPEIGIANGSVDLSGETPIISISAIKSGVGVNIDYLSGVTIANEGDFPDLEIWVDASTVDIFTPGNYTAIYTFNYNEKSVSEEVTVTITENKNNNEPSANDTSSTSKNVASNDQPSKQTTSKNNVSNDATSSKEQQTTSKEQPSSSKNEGTTSKEQQSSSKDQQTSSNNQATQPTTTKPITTKPTTTKPVTTTTSSKATTTSTKATTTTKNNQTTSDDTTTTREIITTSGNKQTESQYIGNYTIELLSGKTVTIRNTTSKYIVSTRTDVSYKERNGYTYKVSKLIITYNTGAEQILETVEERLD